VLLLAFSTISFLGLAVAVIELAASLIITRRIGG